MQTFGNTGAFLVVRRADFEAASGFNESYKSCFEDVELNCKISAMHAGNFTLNSVKAIHRESSTRQQSMRKEDFERLASFISKNMSERQA